jgi:amino acid adenylation domain-containing protein
MTLAIRKQNTLLKSIVADPDESLARLSLLTTAERERLLVEWNDTYAEYPRHRCVHQLFEEQVGRTPEATAVVFENQELSYRELNSRANQLAHHLLKLGVGPDSLVGICVQRSPDLIVGLLGIWKAGGAYVPLDPQYPLDRLSFMLQDSRLKVLITEKPFQSKFSAYKVQLVCIDESISKERNENCLGGSKPDNLAYVIYTSGSTGKPKGVQICHESLVNFLVSMRSSPGLAPEDSLLAVTTISFDIAALELYLPLIVGARLVLATRETAVDGYLLQKTLASTAITVMQATPATWRLLLEAGWQGGNNFKTLCGGEALPRDLAVELLKRVSSVWNMYGPTETTVWSTTSRIASADGPITIGRPIANTEVYVLDDHLEPVPVGAPGELYIGGAGVARGYLNRPELTAEKFIAHPFHNPESGARLYRTGDLARFRANGELECLGRIDNQVKVRGFRIELGEIESILGQYPGVKESVVTAREDTPGDKRLVAYMVVRQAQSVEVDALREFLKQRLPDYMLPSQFVFLEALPLTPNGKVDRRALPMPPQLTVTPQSGHVAPRNQIESRLAKIWESVLSVRPVGVKENFFELGGHSLLVAKLLRRIEHAFGKKLSMAAIFEAPTVEQLSAVLGNSSALRWPSALAPIQPSGSRPPFFCFGYGAGPVFRSLAGRLGPDQPLVGVDPALLDVSQVPAPYRMEDIAACLARQMRELQPDGPYYLGGICGGGLVAYATASHLMAQAQQVTLLALFEPHPSYHDYFVEHSNGFGRGRLGQRLKFHFENLQTLNAREAVAYARDHMRERGRVLLSMITGRLEKTINHLRPRELNGHRRNIRKILGPAYRNYHPRPYSGNLALFQATHREPGGDWERQYWMGLAPKLAIDVVPGYSNWIVRFFVEPNVEILASKLRAYLPGHKTTEAEG